MNKLETNEVYTFKLNSGEELIAKVLEQGTDHIVLNDPVSVAPGPQGMGLVPSLFTGDQDKSVTLNTSAISLYAVTADPVRVKYIEATTGITTSSKKILVG